jgi:hypothetical protein
LSEIRIGEVASVGWEPFVELFNIQKGALSPCGSRGRVGSGRLEGLPVLI